MYLLTRKHIHSVIWMRVAVIVLGLFGVLRTVIFQRPAESANAKQSPVPVNAKKVLARPDRKRAPLAQVVGRCRIAPAAGNGLMPLAATVDTRRDRAIVLCQDTRNLAVIDLRRARLLRTVPLPEYQPDFNGKAIMAYEQHTDTVVVVAGDNEGHVTDDTTHVFTLAAGTQRVIAARRLPAAYRMLLAVDAKSQEMFVPCSEEIKRSEGDLRRYYLQVLDIRSLRSKRRIRLSGPPGDLAWSAHYHAVITIEDTSGEANLDLSQVFMRAATTGRVLGRSLGSYENARVLVVDEARNSVLFGYLRKDQSNYESDAACLTLPTLRARPDGFSALLRRRMTSELDSQTDRATADMRHSRLYLSSPTPDLTYDIKGTMASAEPHPSTIAVSIDGRLSKSVDARFAAAWPRGDAALVFYGHTLAALDGKTLRERWRVPFGARIQGLMVDRRHHKVLAWGEGDSPDPWLVWAGGAKPRYAGRYGQKGPGFDTFDYTGVHLHGEAIEFYPGSLSGPGYRLFGLVIGERPTQVYELLFPDNTDLEAPAAWISVYEGDQELRHVDIHHDYGVSLAYLPGANTLLYAFGRDIFWLSGKTVHLPKETPEPDILSAADAQGKYLYCVDKPGRLVYRIRLSDGVVVAARRLSFACVNMVADAGAGIIYLVDEQGGTVVRIRAF